MTFAPSWAKEILLGATGRPPREVSSLRSILSAASQCGIEQDSTLAGRRLESSRKGRLGSGGLPVPPDEEVLDEALES